MLKIGEVTKLQRVFLRHSVVFSSLVKSTVWLCTCSQASNSRYDELVSHFMYLLVLFLCGTGTTMLDGDELFVRQL